MENIKLYEFFSKTEFSNPYSLAYTIPVPTEFVVTKTQICTPQMARVFRTHFYWYKGSINSYEELYKKHGLRNPSSCPDEIMLVEVWDNKGDDGHTEYRFVGYRYVPFSLFDNERKYPSTWNGELPCCMHWVEEGEPYPVTQWETNRDFMDSSRNPIFIGKDRFS